LEILLTSLKKVLNAFIVTPYSQGTVKSDRQQLIKIIVESLSQHDEKHVVPTPINAIKVRK
jgi:hypothetical protein